MRCSTGVSHLEEQFCWQMTKFEISAGNFVKLVYSRHPLRTTRCGGIKESSKTRQFFAGKMKVLHPTFLSQEKLRNNLGWLNISIIIILLREWHVLDRSNTVLH